MNRKSPAIGFGTLSLLVSGATYKAPEKDLDLNARPGPSGSAPDLGAFESPYSSSLPRANNISDGLSDTLELDFTNSSTTLSARWKSFGSGITYDYAIGTGNLKNNIEDLTKKLFGLDKDSLAGALKIVADGIGERIKNLNLSLIHI